MYYLANIFYNFERRKTLKFQNTLILNIPKLCLFKCSFQILKKKYNKNLLLFYLFIKLTVKTEHKNNNNEV